MTRASPLFRAAVIAALALGLIPGASNSQEDVWESSISPVQTAQGSYCWIGINHAGHTLIQYPASGFGTFITIESPVLASLTVEQESQITFAGDTPKELSYTLYWNQSDKPSTWVANGLVVDGVIDRFVFGIVLAETVGSGISISLGGSGALSFSASGVSEAVEGYGDCSNQL